MNVFMVETPHQLLNAIEAKNRFPRKDNHLVVVLSDEYTVRAYEPLINAGEWTRVHYVESKTDPRRGLGKWLKRHPSARIRGYYMIYELSLLRKNLTEIGRSLIRADDVFLGNYSVDYMRHFSNIIEHDTLYLLDDGTSTIFINKARKEAFQEGFKDSVINAITGLKTGQSEQVTFFTTYDLDVKQGDSLVKNDYRYLRELAASATRTDEIYFLGMTLIVEGLSRERYMEYLRKVLKYFCDEKIVYVPHKLEPPDKVEYIRDQMGLTVRKFPVPIEYQLTMGGTVPKMLASFCCSALENCRVIFGPELPIKSFYIDPEHCPHLSEFVSDIYCYFESKSSPHFEVVRL